MKSYYEILGVSEKASQKEIKDKYKKIALKIHPDRLIGKSKSEVERNQKEFQEITNAYQTLSDENERKKYDSQRDSGFFNSGSNYSGNYSDMDGFDSSGWGFEDIFKNFFGDSRKNSESYRNSKADDIKVSLTISFKELVLGSEKIFSLNLSRSCTKCSQTGAFSRDFIFSCSKCQGTGFIDIIRKSFIGSVRTRSECDRCQGSGKIITKKCEDCKGFKLIGKLEKIDLKIPKGIKAGQRIILKKRGNDGLNKQRGDIIVEIKIKGNKIFQIKDNDIHSSVPISFIDAILGVDIKVVTVEGVEIVNIPKFSQVGDYVILRNKGLFIDIGKEKRGNFYVWLQVKLPKKIGRETEEIFTKIRENTSWNPNRDFVEKNKDNLGE